MGNNTGGLYSIILLVVMFGFMYLIMIRPQRKREKADQEMRAALKVGDEIITIGGIIGKVEKITDKTVVISTTAGKNKIELLKTSVASVSKQSQPGSSSVKESSKSEEEDKKPNREKKITPKKLGKKSEEATSEEKKGDAEEKAEEKA